jgi:hypothetical protein
VLAVAALNAGIPATMRNDAETTAGSSAGMAVAKARVQQEVV